MKSSRFVTSKKGHSYYCHTDHPLVNLCNPLLAEIFSDRKETIVDSEEKIFYEKKFNYLVSILSDKSDSETKIQFVGIDSSIIEDNIANLRQIVFEVTDSCNLKCKYCGYGEFYGDYDKRKNRKINTEHALSFFKQLEDIWEKIPNRTYMQTVHLSFYGGEPLLNMPFIKQIVKYGKCMNSTHRRFVFSMTTNAVLLNKYIDFLAENRFDLLISLDGDELGHSYRVDKLGKPSFNRVIRNIDLLKEKYPEYFKENVNFNAVLHNRNSVSAIHDFIHIRYGKYPTISSLNNTGIRPEKTKEFYAMYKNVSDSLFQSEHYREIEKDMFLKLPDYKDAATFLIKYSGYVFDNYNSFFNNKKMKNYTPTGTCTPFSKKIFITVNGKILPCERIGQQFGLGNMDENGIHWNFDEISQMYNRYFTKLQKYCSTCYRQQSCIQCIFNIDEIDGEYPVCHGYTNSNMFSKYIENHISFFEEHASDYYKILDEVSLN